jgi:hypothetical protein
MPIIAIVHSVSNPNKPYRYPFIYRLLKWNAVQGAGQVGKR